MFFKDNDSTDRARIYADAFSNHRDECVFLYRIITLLDERDMEIEERLNRAFRYDAESDKQDIVQECLDSFNSYVRGGIEYMYTQFTTGCTSKDDYIRQSFEVSRKFKESLLDNSYSTMSQKITEVTPLVYFQNSPPVFGVSDFSFSFFHVRLGNSLAGSRNRSKYSSNN